MKTSKRVRILPDPRHTLLWQYLDNERGGHVEWQVGHNANVRVLGPVGSQLLGEDLLHVEVQHVPRVDVQPGTTHSLRFF